MLKLKIGFLTFLFTAFSLTGLMAQQTQVKGKVQDSADRNPLVRVLVSIENSTASVYTDYDGSFVLRRNLPTGNQVLALELEGYEGKRYPIIIREGETLDLGTLSLDLDFESVGLGISEITLSDNELDDDDLGTASNISGLLSASKDVFFNAAAYDFGATFFKPRGLDNENGVVLINGIEMNKMSHGRPEFAHFGGLNDVKRNEVFFEGLEANPYQFGGIAGTTNSIMRASKYWRGGRVSYAAANQSYQGRVMGSYNSGLMPSGWAYSFLVSRRFGDHGYVDGTSYNTNSFFASVEKKINEEHSINFTGFFTPYRRGKSTAITEEVKDLKGRQYNPNWGVLNGDNRNSRIKEVEEPVIMLNHFWTINNDTELNTNVAYQFGHIGNTRIDNGGTRLVIGPDGQKSYLGGAKNPTPHYYQNLPSYHLRFDDLTSTNYMNAYLAEKAFLEDGQMDWYGLYEANQIALRNGGNSTYIIQDEREQNNQLTVNTIFNTRLTDHIKLNAALNYRNLRSQFYSRVGDLMGGTGFLDVDFFADESNEATGLAIDLAQSDLNNPDRVVKEGDRYKYNYDINAEYGSAFVQGLFNYRNVDFFLGGDVSYTSYQRDGKFRNGHFAEASYGKGEKLDFTNYSAKAGVLYKITGQHMLRLNGAYLTKAPTMMNSYANARQNEFPVIGLTSEKIGTADVSYIYRSPIVKARVTGFYSGIEDATRIGHYFTQGLSGLGENNDAAFVHEVMTGVNMRNLGFEFGIEAKVTPTITLKAAGSMGQSVYTNNPNLYVMSEDFHNGLFHGSQREFAEAHDGSPLIFGDGTTKIKNYHVAGGPERAFQIGFEYRDPDFWFVGATTNFFSHGYVDISKIRRTSNFTTDLDGLPLGDYDEARARELLKQERFDDFMLVNLMGGKSWRVGKYFIGVFGVVSNIFNQEYKTGGFESSRRSNFTNYNQDMSAPYGPQFGNNYFYGYGTTFYANVYLRF